jgi:hypothetical protein
MDFLSCKFLYRNEVVMNGIDWWSDAADWIVRSPI